MIIFLKAIIQKMITVPGYTKRDGTYVPPHQKQVHVESDHAPKFDEHHLPESNTNAKTHNKKVLLIQQMHEAGDIGGLQGMKHGVNTYGKKQAKLAQASVDHLSTHYDPPAPEPEPEKPAEPTSAATHVMDWESYKLPHTNTNAPSHNKKVDAIAALHAAGDHEGLLAMKHGVNTYGKKQALLAKVAAAHLKEGGKPTPAPAPEITPPAPQTAPPAPKVVMRVPKAPEATAPAAAALTMPEQVYHNTTDGHSKSWSVSVEGSVVTAKFGKIGAKQQVKTWTHASPEEAQAAAQKSMQQKQANGYKLQSGTMEAMLAPTPAPAPEPDPKDGDTKQGADGMLVLKDGRWHKVEEEKPASLAEMLDAVPLPDGLTHAKTAILAAFKARVLADGSEAFKKVKKKVTSPKHYAHKKMHVAIPTAAWGVNKIWAWVDKSESGQITGATDNGKQLVAMLDYIDQLKTAHAAHTGAPAKPKAAKKAPKLVLPSNQESASSMAAAATSKKVDGLSVAVIDKWEQTGPQKGSNPGGAFKDPAGQQWYVKFPQSADHAKNELLAAKLYKAAGIDVPQLRLVEKDGKIGIASKMVDGVSKVGAGIKDAPGAQEGFVVDAWLANHDAVGTGYDNLLKTKDGKAIRIDVGGSLLYRAQGAPKGDLFGDEVSEIENMRNAKVNQYGAAVYGSATKAHLITGAASVLEIPNDVIEQLVTKFGPGDEAAKQALAAKLIARKAYLAKKFPEADAIANPPKPDHRNLPVEPSKLPALPNFLNWNGAGKGLSSVHAVNQANQEAVQQIYDSAMKGDFSALKKLKYQLVNKQTGAVEKVGEAFADHPSQYVRNFYSTVVDYMEVIANPAAKKAKSWSTEEYSDIHELSDGFGAHFYGVSVGDVPANERLGFWISLGEAEGAAAFKPQQTTWLEDNAGAHAKAVASTKAMPANLKTWMKAVKASGAHNQPYRDGKEVDNQGQNARAVLKAAYEHAVELPEGTEITKYITMPDAMKKQIDALPDGHVFQNPGSMCCSYAKGWSWSGDTKLRIIYAKGAKALYNVGVGSHNGEKEITTIPGQRFMVLEKKLVGGVREISLLMLPPDETYVANIHPKGDK